MPLRRGRVYGGVGGGATGRGAGGGGLGPLMATVTDKDIMREFSSVAAKEAAAGLGKKKLPSEIASDGERGGEGGKGVNTREAKQSTGRGGVDPKNDEEGAGTGAVDDESRPTGYRCARGFRISVHVCLFVTKA